GEAHGLVTGVRGRGRHSDGEHAVRDQYVSRSCVERWTDRDTIIRRHHAGWRRHATRGADSSLDDGEYSRCRDQARCGYERAPDWRLVRTEHTWSQPGIH